MNRVDVCVILGGGGHARVLIDAVQSSGAARLYAILDSDRTRWGQRLLDVPILGDDELLAEISRVHVNCFAIGLGAGGGNSRRERLFELGLAHQLRPLTVTHPAAVCSQWATVGAGCQLFPGSVVNAGAVLGVNVIVNTGAIVEHDCVMGRHVHVATGASLASTVTAGDRAHIGAGAVVRQCLTIGEDAVVGAGAVVVRDVPPRTVVVGVPAHILREIQ